MTLKWLTATLSALTLTTLGLAGCAVQAEPQGIEAPSQPPSMSSTPMQTSTPVSTATPTAPAVGPPQGCLDYKPAPITHADGGDAIASAATTASLPTTVVLNPGMQVIASVDEPGQLEAAARVCSEPLVGDALIEVANTIAQAIYADPAHERLAVLVVSSWTPDASTGYLKQVDAITVDDYQSYLWDSPVAQATAWE